MSTTDEGVPDIQHLLRDKHVPLRVMPIGVFPFTTAHVYALEERWYSSEL